MKKILFPTLLLLIFAFSGFTQSRDERNVGHFTGVKASGSFDVFLKKGSEEKVVIEAGSGPIEKIITEVDGNTLEIYIDDNRNNYHFRNVDIYVTFKELNSIAGSGSGSVRLESPLSSDDLYLASSGSGSFYCSEKLESDGDVKIANSGSGGFKISSAVSAANNMEIHNSGSGGVDIGEVYSDEFSAHNSGSGSLNIDGGKTDSQSIVLSGSGSYHAENFESNDCNVRKSGSGSVHVNVRDQLTGNSSGSGNIYVKGTTARLDFHTSGSGKIKTSN